MVFVEKLFFNKGAYLLVIGMEYILMYRFYYSRDRIDYSKSDYYFQTFLIFALDSLLFVCLYRASSWDCGKILSEQKPSLLNTEHEVCHKCSAVRTHEFVHHCSRCDACIDMMDHHCTFLG